MLKSQIPGADGQSNMLENVLQLVNNPQTGGLAGLAQRFTEGGLGKEVGSWVSTGQNLPVSPQQIQAVIGNTPIQDMASKLGMTPEQTSTAIAALLPQVIDKLTPNGSMPQGGDLLQQGLGMLKNKFF
ncbi:MAG: DUF937 domain-containing protein [Chlorobiales bacterium]|nr:DUF937 domain-containing protein [Chlorobiales bacterium]